MGNLQRIGVNHRERFEHSPEAPKVSVPSENGIYGGGLRPQGNYRSVECHDRSWRESFAHLVEFEGWGEAEGVGEQKTDGYEGEPEATAGFGGVLCSVALVAHVGTVCRRGLGDNGILEGNGRAPLPGCGVGGGRVGHGVGVRQPIHETNRVRNERPTLVCSRSEKGVVPCIGRWRRLGGLRPP